MAHIAQPENCQVRLSPFSQRLLQYNITESNIYLSKSSNALLNPYIMGYYGDRLPDSSRFPRSHLKYTDRLDCIIDGLENEFTLYGDILECIISPGQCIVDQTLLIFPEETKLDISINTIEYSTDIARCILSVNFQWLETLYEQPPRLRLMMIDPNDPLTFGPDIWETRIDRMVISYFDINLVNRQVYKNHNPIPAENYIVEYININTVPYEVGPNIIFLINFVNYIHKHFARKKIVYTKPCINPEGLKENEITIPITFFNKETGTLDPIIGIRFDIIYNPAEIHFPKFVSNKRLLDLTKVTNVYVDKNSLGIETGLIRIQIGENAYTPTIIPDLELGQLTFYFNSAAPAGTVVNLNIENVTLTYSNATVSNLRFIPREPETVETNLQSPVLTYQYQQAEVNFGSIVLSNDQHLLFYLNGVLEAFSITDDVLSNLSTDGYHDLNTQLRLTYSKDEEELHLFGLDANITFTNPSIINDIATDKKLSFASDSASPGEWIISNKYWYWIPTEYDVISVVYNLTNYQTYALTNVDIAQLTSNIGMWVIIPSADDHILQLQYMIVGTKPIVKMRINPTFASDFTLTSASYTMKNGSGLISHVPSIKDYRRAQHIYDLTGIDLNEGDFITYEDNIYNEEKTVTLTADIIDVLRTDTYGYKDGNLRIYINVANRLTLEPIIYNTDFINSFVHDEFLNYHYPEASDRPCIWFKNTFISTRPVGSLTFVEDRDKVYATCWQQGNLNWQSAGERDFFCTIDISDLNNTELVHVQVVQNNFIITPESVELLLPQHQIRIWMPEQFVFQDPMDQLVIYILG